MEIEQIIKCCQQKRLLKKKSTPPTLSSALGTGGHLATIGDQTLMFELGMSFFLVFLSFFVFLVFFFVFCNALYHVLIIMMHIDYLLYFVPSNLNE